MDAYLARAEKVLAQGRRRKELRVPRPLKISLIILLFLGFIAIFGPRLAPYGVNEMTDELLVSPRPGHWFGTDDIGRDIFTMVLYGARTSLLVGIVAALISMFIGTSLGAVAGYYGGKLDRFLNELINIFLMLPTFFLIIMVVAIFGSSMAKVTLVIGLTSWMGTAKLMNAQTKSLKERTFVKAGQVLGERDQSILFRYIVPHGIFPVLANVSQSVSSAILFEASLSFLGLGDPNVMSWGQIIYLGKAFMGRGWWVAAFGGLAIIITMFAFHLLAEGLNQILQPQAGGR